LSLKPLLPGRISTDCGQAHLFSGDRARAISAPGAMRTIENNYHYFFSREGAASKIPAADKKTGQANPDRLDRGARTATITS
jgi:hypothetical protein